jgi:PAS domain S-box-containing protein
VPEFGELQAQKGIARNGYKMKFFGQSLRYRIMFLIVLVALPIAIFDVYKETQAKQENIIKATEDLTRSSDAVVGKVHDLIETSHELLTTLAGVKEISSGNIEACTNLLQEVGARYTKYSNFSVVNEDKYIVCSSGPLPKPVLVAHSPNINQAFATGKFAVSPFKFGVLSGKPILVFSEPLLDQNKVVGTVNTGLNLTWVAGYFSSVFKHKGEQMVMFDDGGVVLASYPNGSFPVGITISEVGIPHLARDVKKGTGTFKLESGEEMIGVVAVIPHIPKGANVVSFTSLDSLESVFLMDLYQRLMIVGFLTTLSLILAWGGARALLINPINRLVVLSEALAKGNLKARSDVSADMGELGRLGQTFDQMADALDTRTAAMEQAREAMLDSETKLRAIFQSSGTTAIISSDDEGNIVSWNPGAEKVFGYNEKEILGQPTTRIIPDRYKGAHSKGLSRVVETGAYKIIGKTVELSGLHKDGHEVPVSLSLGAWEVGQRKYFSAIINDITVRKQSEKKINQLAYTDYFTGMPNEAFFLERLNENIDQNCQGFVASIELSGMGDIVGTFGLEASELIIYETGKRLNEQMNPLSVVARTGERLFKVLYISDDENEIAHLAAIAERFYQVASDSFDLMGSSVFVHVSMGISLIDREESTAKLLLTDVEIALHEAKNSITSSIVFFEDSIKKQLVRSTQIVAWLRSAIENSEFKLFFQPQFNLKTNTIVGCEALIRWPQSSQEWISPGEFIPIAERSGLIEEITTWTVDNACMTAASWLSEQDLKIRVGVNISAEELASPEFLRYVTNFIQVSGLPAELLEIEITETALMKDVVMATRNLRKIRDMGASIAIDDFGTGQASLAYLKNFPIDRLKIDQSFVNGAPTNKTDQEIIVSIVNLAHSLGLEVIAEGAEEEEHIKLLVALGCDEVQGFYIAKPMPAEEFVDFVKAYR